MNESTHQRIEEFLGTLRTALEGSGGRSGDIVEEVRTDLHDHIARHRTQGASEEEAVERALTELGNPYELAHHVRGEVAPFGGTVATTIRYLLAGGLIIWTLVLLWNVRAWTYGTEGIVATGFFLLLHAIPVLLIWPRVVWRKNWLFGLIPAGIGLAVALFLAGAGVSSSQTIEIPIGDDPTVALPPPAPEPEAPTLPRLIGFGSTGLAIVVLLIAMQQTKQRRLAILAILLPLILIEVAFQIEEAVFRRKLDEKIEAGESGLFWPRPLNSGFSIHHSSADGQIRIQD